MRKKGKPQLRLFKLDDGVDALSKRVPADVWIKIVQQRELVLTAFIAKIGCQPEDVVQVVRFYPDRVTWRLHHRDKGAL
jgi:hypothetical protein